jgi:2,3-bisphosphoglycerate-independent phosphoglycerate mutase
MMVSLEWRDMAAIVTTAAVVGGIVLAFLRFKLQGDFAARGELAKVAQRVDEVEDRLAKMPSHSDLRALQDRVAELDRAVAVVAERVTGVHAILTRIEHQTGLLLHYHLTDGAPDSTGRKR